MDKRRHILLVGSSVFAQRATAMLGSGEDIDTLHTAHVTIELFLAKWQPECAIIDCDELEGEAFSEIEALSRFQPKVTTVLVSSRPVSQLNASEASAILLPSEMYAMLGPLVMSLLTETANCSA